MSELQQYYNAICTGYWADPDPDVCPCRRGWFLSDVDTFHKCRYHWHGQPHPEDERSDEEVASLAAPEPQPVPVPEPDSDLPF